MEKHKQQQNAFNQNKRRRVTQPDNVIQQKRVDISRQSHRLPNLTTNKYQHPYFRHAPKVYKADGVSAICYVDYSIPCIENDKKEMPYNQVRPYGPPLITEDDYNMYSTTTAADVLTEERCKERRMLCEKIRGVEVSSYEFCVNQIKPDPITGERVWPESTTAACWWDCHPFTWTPFPLPIHCREIRKHPGYASEVFLDANNRGFTAAAVPRQPKLDAIAIQQQQLSTLSKTKKKRLSTSDVQYICTGVFCGPSCALAYAMANRITHAPTYINMVARDFGYLGTLDDRREMYEHGVLDRVTPAPPRELLQMFNTQENMLTIEEFRMLCLCGITTRIRDPIYITRSQIAVSEQKQARARAIASKCVIHEEDAASVSKKTTHELLREVRNAKRTTPGATSLRQFFDVVDTVSITAVNAKPITRPHK